MFTAGVKQILVKNERVGREKETKKKTNYWMTGHILHWVPITHGEWRRLSQWWVPEGAKWGTASQSYEYKWRSCSVHGVLSTLRIRCRVKWNIKQTYRLTKADQCGTSQLDSQTHSKAIRNSTGLSRYAEQSNVTSSLLDLDMILKRTTHLGTKRQHVTFSPDLAILKWFSLHRLTPRFSPP